MARAIRLAHHNQMTDHYSRIQEHLGTALRKLSIFEGRAARGHETARDTARCLGDLQRVAQELDQAFEALKSERHRVTSLAEDADLTMRRARNMFVQSPNPCLILTRDGAAIADANPAASRLLNVSQRHLIGKAFTNFLQQDREAFLRELKSGADGAGGGWEVTLRPRERAMVRVVVKAIADHGDEEHTAAIVLSPAINGAATHDAA